MRITDYTPSYRQTNALGKRPLMTPDEILRMKPDEELVFIRGQDVYRAHRFDYSKHTHYKKLKNTKSIYHVPDWKREADSQALSISEQKTEEAIYATPVVVADPNPTEEDTEPKSSKAVAKSLGLRRADINETI